MATKPDVSLKIGAEFAELKAQLAQAMGELRKFRAEAERKGKAPDLGFGNLNSQIQSGITALKGLAGAFVAFKGLQLFAGFIRQGVEFNKTLETAELGIASIISATADLVDAQGKAVKGQDALTVAIALSKEQMKQLRIAGLQTAATTQELVEGFQIAIGPGLAAGLDPDQINKLTVQVVQAATAMGVPLNQLGQEIRALFSGQIDKNARIGQILQLDGPTIEKWKEAGTLFENLNKELAPFSIAGKEAAKTFEVIASNAREAMQVTAGQATEGFFDSMKKALASATEGLFDTDNLRIAAPFEDLLSVLKEIIDLIGEGVAGSITGAVDLARDLSAYFKENREEISEIIQSVGLLFNQLLEIVGIVFQIGGGVADAGVKISLFSTVLQTIAVLIAGVRDGFRFIGSVVVWLGSLLIKAVLTPLENILSLVSRVVGLANKEAAKEIDEIRKQVADVSKDGFEAAEGLMKPLLDGTGAVAKAIAKIDELKKKAAEAGKLQKGAAGGGGGGIAPPGGKPEKFMLRELVKEADESFRIFKDALDRETRTLEQALDDRKINIQQFYAEKERLAEQGFANEKARLTKERTALAQHLAEVNRQSTLATDSKESEQAAKEALKTKRELAKVNADLLILERSRAETIANITREATTKEREYQRALQDTRNALLRSQGQDLEARLNEIAAARDKFLREVAQDSEGIDLANQLFNAETLKARIDDAERQLDGVFTRFAEAERQIAEKVELGVLGQVDSEQRLQQIRVESIEQVQQYITLLEELAAKTNDPDLLQKIDAAKLKLMQMRQEQFKLVTQIKDAGADALADFFDDIIEGSKSASEAIRDLARNFISAIGRMAAEALAKNIMGSLFGGANSGGGGMFGGGGGGGFLGNLFKSFGSMFGGGGGGGGFMSGQYINAFHRGGIVGQGGQPRLFNPLAFAGAPRYHGGGMVGVAANEQAAILQRGEEVLTRSDPRHAGNGGGGYRIVNVVDPGLVGDYMNSSAGEKTVLNTISRNPGYIKQVLGG